MSLYLAAASLVLAGFAADKVVATDNATESQYSSEIRNRDVKNLAAQIAKVESAPLTQLSLENIGLIFDMQLNNQDYRLPGPSEDIGSLASAESGNKLVRSLNFDANDRFNRRLLAITLQPGAKVTFHELVLIDQMPKSLAEGYIISRRSGNGFYGTTTYQSADKRFVSNITLEYYPDEKSKNLYDLVHQINQLERLQQNQGLTLKAVEAATGYQLQPVPQKARSIYDEQFAAGRYFGRDGKRLDEMENGKKIIRDVFFGAINASNSKHLELTMNANSKITDADITKIFGKPDAVKSNEYADPNGVQSYNRHGADYIGELSFHYNDKRILETISLTFLPKSSSPH